MTRMKLFGPYNWGGGEWMGAWESECVSAGCQLVAEPVIVCGTPDDDVAQVCKS